MVRSCGNSTILSGFNIPAQRGIIREDAHGNETYNGKCSEYVHICCGYAKCFNNYHILIVKSIHGL